MTILLTGASGLVGAAFARAAARRGHRVLGVVNRFTGPLEGLASRHPVDLADEAAVTRLALDHFPEAIVNAAAVSEPAACDADPAHSQALNVALPALLARFAHHLSARFIHLSSEQVFDGTQAPYAIAAPPRPLNLYGRQKLASEQAIQAAAPTFAATVRAPLLMGNSPSGRRSLHERLFADWAAGRTPSLYTDEIRQPCTAENLADVLLELCERPTLCGVFHWAGTDPLSRYALAEGIRARFKLTPTQAPLTPLTRGPEALRRPANLALDLQPLAGLLKTPVQSFATQLESLIVPPPCREWYFAGSSG